ncbi:hypothetical protein MMC31_005046 [Peltigera leucophlebia]|nr:hypothetical protein [Peltigera leucophlebia]
MAPKARSAFAGGWSEAKAAAVNKVQLPAKIRCSICKKHKNADLYSKKQLLDLRHHIHLGFDMKNSPIRCRTCTACQTHEMTCCICNEVKGLDAFSKAQRRTPDRARCQECVNQHLTLRPGFREYDDVELEDDSDDSTNMLTNNYESHASWHPGSDITGLEAGMQRLTTENLQAQFGDDMPKAGAVTETEYLGPTSKKDKGPARQENHTDVDGWQVYSRTNAKAHGQTPIEFTGFDPQGAPHRQTRAPSIISEDFGSRRSNQTSRHTGYSQAPAKKGSRFAKPPREATPPPPQPSTSIFVGRTVDYDGSESDDDWGVLP